MSNPFHRAIFLTGPTAVGKTAIGVALAKRLDAEVIALDSMTLYRGMNIGTAKPTLGERGAVQHHLIDIVDPWDSATVADYRTWAERTIAEIEGRGHRVLFVGGTALYLKALLRGLFEGPAADPTIRHELEIEAVSRGHLAIHQRLSSIDPITAQRLHPNDLRRVIRALEVFAATGQPLSAYQVEHSQIAPDHVCAIALTRARPALLTRIDQRVEEMFKNGLVDEVEQLTKAARPIHETPAQAVGYHECREYLAGNSSLVQAVERTSLRTRQFSKRQATWFRGLAEVDSLLIDDNETVDQVVERLLGVIEKKHKMDRGLMVPTESLMGYDDTDGLPLTL